MLNTKIIRIAHATAMRIIKERCNLPIFMEIWRQNMELLRTKAHPHKPVLIIMFKHNVYTIGLHMPMVYTMGEFHEQVSEYSHTG